MNTYASYSNKLKQYYEYLVLIKFLQSAYKTLTKEFDNILTPPAMVTLRGSYGEI